MVNQFRRRFDQSQSRQRYQIGEDLASKAETSELVDIENSGSAVVANVSAINFNTKLLATDDGDGSATVDLRTQGKLIESLDNNAVVISETDFGTDGQVVIGTAAEANSSFQVSLGRSAHSGASTNRADIAIGNNAFVNANGGGSAVGQGALFASTSSRSAAIGDRAGLRTTVNQAMCMGQLALEECEGDDNVGVGRFALNVAGSSDKFNNGVTAIGTRAGLDSSSEGSIYIGFRSGEGNKNDGVVAFGFNAGSPAMGTGVPANTFVVNNASGNEGFRYDLDERSLLDLSFLELLDRSSDPADPASGQSRIWQSDGTGTGDDGDILVKITDSNGTVKTATLVDFSAV